MRFNKNTIAATVILALAATQTAYANLVSNGSFTDYQDLITGLVITDWQVTSAATGSGIGLMLTPTFNAIAFGAGAELNDILTQTLTTTVGTRYEIDFALAMSTSEPSNFQASFGGNEFLHFYSAGNGEFINYSFFETATSTSTELLFAGYNTNAFNFLTNVSVVVTPAAVPEPQQWGMLLLGLGGIASALQRKSTRMVG